MVLIQHSESSQLVKAILREKEFQDRLALLRQHHKETYDHSIRVGLLSTDIGYDFSHDEEMLSVLSTARMLHDIGKRKIPKELLSKRIPLTGEKKYLDAVLRRLD